MIIQVTTRIEFDVASVIVMPNFPKPTCIGLKNSRKKLPCSHLAQDITNTLSLWSKESEKKSARITCTFFAVSKVKIRIVILTRTQTKEVKPYAGENKEYSYTRAQTGNSHVLPSCIINLYRDPNLYAAHAETFMLYTRAPS